MKKLVCLTLLLSLLFVTSLWAQGNRIIVNADQELSILSRQIYGHFTKHLGKGIYGGRTNALLMNMAGFRIFSFSIMYPQLKTVLAKNN